MKKRLILLPFVIMIAFMLTGCGSDSEGKKPTNDGTKDSGEASNMYSLSTKETIEEKVIVDKKDIKITVKSIEYTSLGIDLKVLIENNSKKNVTVQARDFSINDLMLDPVFSANVAAGKKVNDTITVLENQLERAKITKIKDIEFAINVFNSDSWKDIFTEKGIKLSTNASDYEQEYNTDGFLAADKKDIKIYVLKLDDEDSFWGAEVTVYIENNSKNAITVQARDVSINGFMVNPAFSTSVMPGKKAYDTITFLESDLEDNNITDIKEIELKFTAFNSKNYKDIFKTKATKITFE